MTESGGIISRGAVFLCFCFCSRLFYVTAKLFVGKGEGGCYREKWFCSAYRGAFFPLFSLFSAIGMEFFNIK